VGIAFQIYKVTSTVCLGIFTFEDGSIEAFDEVMIAMQPVIKKYSLAESEEAGKEHD
jgi:hypothetical protein